GLTTGRQSMQPPVEVGVQSTVRRAGFEAAAVRPAAGASSSAEPSQTAVLRDEPTDAPVDGAPAATRRDLQLGRRLFQVVNGLSTATGYALFFTHEQVVHIFGAIACLVYILDRVRMAYPGTVARRAPWVNRTFLRAEEQVREAAMTPFAIA